jgi:hypothetical protein
MVLLPRYNPRMNFTLIVEQKDDAYCFSSKSGHFDPILCPVRVEALLRQLETYDLTQEEIQTVRAQLREKRKAEVEVSSPVAIRQLDPDSPPRIRPKTSR